MSRPILRINVEKESRDDWRSHLESHLKAGEDVDVIGLDCEADKVRCHLFAETYGYYYDCLPKFGESHLDYARFRNKKFHSRKPPALT